MSLRYLFSILCFVAFSYAGTRLPVSQGQQDEIVQFFNLVRSRVDPPAANMQSMSWDNGVADNAWAAVYGTNQGCFFGHNGPVLAKQQNGQNIAFHGNTPAQNAGHTMQELFLEGWANEKIWWTYGVVGDGSTCKAPADQSCWHYTAMIWAETNRIGCAYVDCPASVAMPNGSPSPYHTVLACNFAPAGNYPRTPYVVAPRPRVPPSRNTGPDTAPSLTTPLKFNPLPPKRLIDTRDLEAIYANQGKFTSGMVRTYNIYDLGSGIPNSGVVAFSGGIQVVDTDAAGYITFWPSHAQKPLASATNQQFGLNIYSSVYGVVSQQGNFNIFSTGVSNLLLDITGYFSASNGYSFYALNPYRVFDTRATGWAASRQIAGISEKNLAPTSVVPPGAAAISFTAALISGSPPTPDTYVAMWPGDQNWGGSSSGLFNHGNTGETAGVVGMSAGGALKFMRAPPNQDSNLDMAFDVDGYFANAGPGALNFFPLSAPARVYDSRPTSYHGAGTSPPIQVAGVVGVPSNAAVVVATVTAIGCASGDCPTTKDNSNGYVTLWPVTVGQPVVSQLQLSTGQTVMPLALNIPLKGGNSIFVYMGTTGNIAIDIVGFYLPASGAAQSANALALHAGSNLPAPFFPDDPKWTTPAPSPSATTAAQTTAAPVTSAVPHDNDDTDLPTTDDEAPQEDSNNTFADDDTEWMAANGQDDEDISLDEETPDDEEVADLEGDEEDPAANDDSSLEVSQEEEDFSEEEDASEDENALEDAPEWEDDGDALDDWDFVSNDIYIQKADSVTGSSSHVSGGAVVAVIAAAVIVAIALIIVAVFVVTQHQKTKNAVDYRSFVVV